MFYCKSRGPEWQERFKDSMHLNACGVSLPPPPPGQFVSYHEHQFEALDGSAHCTVTAKNVATRWAYLDVKTGISHYWHCFFARISTCPFAHSLVGNCKLLCNFLRTGKQIELLWEGGGRLLRQFFSF